MTRIGIISPYPGFSEVAARIAAEQGHEVEVCQAVLDEAVRVAAQWEDENLVDAVIARGLTAAMIRARLTRVPVIAIEIASYDILEAFHRARRHSGKIAFIDYDYPDQPYDLREILGFDFTPMLYDTRLGALLQAEAEVQKHRSVEYRNKRGQAVLEAIREGVISVDRHGRVSLYNSAAERILGLSAQEAVGRPGDYLPERQHHCAPGGDDPPGAAHQGADGPLSVQGYPGDQPGAAGEHCAGPQVRPG